MATYSPMVITSAGQQALAQAQAGETLTFTRFQIGSGQLSTTLTSALTQGSSYNSLSVAATQRAINSGDSITIGVGASAQTVTASAAAAAGSTSISVNSFTASSSFAAGTIVTDITDAQSLTALITAIDYFPVSTENVSGNTANVTGVYQNTNLTASTYTCEIGLYASTTTTGEVLYAYANAGTLGDTFPAYSSGPFSRQFQISTSVSNVASVTANVPSTVYIAETEKGAANGVASLDSTGNVPASQLGNVPPVHAAEGSALGTVELPASAGSPTTPVAVYRGGSVEEYELTDTNLDTVLTYTPQANGNFLVAASVRIGGVSNVDVTLEITWTDSGGSQTDTRINAQSLAPGTHDVPIKFINALSGDPINVEVQAGTASEAYVSAAIVGV